MELKKYKLGEIADIITGYPFDGHKYSTSGIQVLRGENIGCGFLHWEDRINKKWNENFTNFDNYLLKYGDIVMQMDGNIGKNIAYIDTKNPMLLAQRVACIRAKKDYSQSYIYGILRSQYFYEYISKRTTGTSVQHISLKQISDFSFSFHNKYEQKSIGYLLSILDKKIKLNKTINQNLPILDRSYNYRS